MIYHTSQEPPGGSGLCCQQALSLNGGSSHIQAVASADGAAIWAPRLGRREHHLQRNTDHVSPEPVMLTAHAILKD